MHAPYSAAPRSSDLQEAEDRAVKAFRVLLPPAMQMGARKAGNCEMKRALLKVCATPLFDCSQI